MQGSTVLCCSQTLYTAVSCAVRARGAALFRARRHSLQLGWLPRVQPAQPQRMRCGPKSHAGWRDDAGPICIVAINGLVMRCVSRSHAHVGHYIGSLRPPRPGSWLRGPAGWHRVKPLTSAVLLLA